jgi:hypothetical protein
MADLLLSYFLRLKRCALGDATTRSSIIDKYSSPFVALDDLKRIYPLRQWVVQMLLEGVSPTPRMFREKGPPPCAGQERRVANLLRASIEATGHFVFDIRDLQVYAEGTIAFARCIPKVET